MKIKDKELEADLEAVAKEVESWPAWKRSIDLRELNNPAKGILYSSVENAQTICKNCKRVIIFAFEDVCFCQYTDSAYCDATPKGEGEHEPDWLSGSEYKGEQNGNKTFP